MGLPAARQDVLKAVREQALLLRGHETTHDSQWTRGQWHAAFEFLFFQEPAPTHDDLLFFVTQGKDGASHGSPPYILLRKTTQLPAQFGISSSQFDSISWPQTVLLNLVLQAHYELAVVACRLDQLPRVAEGLDLGPDAVVVTKPVYASPARSAVNLQTARARSQPVPAYPDTYFHIDDYDSAFEDMVLRYPDDCFCVVLRAVSAKPEPPHPPSQQPRQQLSDTAGPSPQETTEGKAHQGRHLVLFSGYVFHRQIEEYLGGKLHKPFFSLPTILGRLFNSNSSHSSRAAGSAAQRHAVPMNGPGGIGRAEVAVAAVPAALPHALGDGSAQQPLGQGAADIPPDNEPADASAGIALQCALVSVSLHVDHLFTSVLQLMVDPDEPPAIGM